MYKATLIEGNTWAVSETDVDGHVTARHKVAVRAGGTGDDAIAAVQEEKQGPSPEEIATQAVAARIAAVKAACTDRIFAVADRNAQMNLALDAGGGLFSPAQMDVFRAGLAWRTAMQNTCRAMIADPALDHTDNAAWPPVPDGLADLIKSV